MSHWRGESRRVIRMVIAANLGADRETLKAAISAAYPFGPRQFHPYKIWLSEVKAQLKPDLPTGPCWCGHGKAAHRARFGKDSRCFAADCSCEGFSITHPAQEQLL